jgi:hypothetical protein
MNKKKEIFTIGDKTTLGIITCFRLLDNEIMVDFDNKNSILLRSKQLQHVKQPLFTTEDGVDIFEGDYYYPVEKTYYFLHEKQTNNHCTNDDKFWIFSTKEKAEEFILMNKPCLSLNDITTIYKGINKKTNHPSSQANQLKNLVKQKLNNNN